MMREFLRQWEFVISPFLNLIPLFTGHFARIMLSSKWVRWTYYFLFPIYSVYLARIYIRFSGAPKLSFYELTGATLVYAGFLFVVLSEAMLAGLKTALTKWRDEKWAKEMDYVYLILGAVGLAISTNRLDIVDQKLSMPEYLGPFVLATALVVRALKTRVEINGWNKLESV